MTTMSFYYNQPLRFSNLNAPYGRAETFRPWSYAPQPLPGGDIKFKLVRPLQRQRPPLSTIQGVQRQRMVAPSNHQEQQDSPARVNLETQQQEQAARVLVVMRRQQQQSMARPSKEVLQQKQQHQQSTALSSLQAPGKRRDEELSPVEFPAPAESPTSPPRERAVWNAQSLQNDELQQQQQQQQQQQNKENDTNRLLVPHQERTPVELNERVGKITSVVAAAAAARQEPSILGSIHETETGADESLLDISLTETKTKDWQENFCQLENFKKEHGHVQVPNKYPKDQQLSNWLKRLRYNMLNDNSSGKLKCAVTRKKRREQLRALGVTFPFEQPSSHGRNGRPSADTQDQAWQEKFLELQQFKKDHGHVQVPHKYPPNQKLSTWLRSQLYVTLSEDSSRKMKCDATRKKRRQKLMSLGVEFTKERRKEQRRFLGSTSSIKESVPSQGGGDHLSSLTEDGIWQLKYGELENFKLEHGHVQVPPIYPQNQPLRNWLNRREQPQLFGVTFPDIRHSPHESEANQKWESRFAELERFKQAYGHVAVPVSSSDYSSLAQWLMKERFGLFSHQNVASEELQSRRSRLEALGVTFSVEENAAHGRKRLSSVDSYAGQAKKTRLA